MWPLCLLAPIEEGGVACLFSKKQALCHSDSKKGVTNVSLSVPLVGVWSLSVPVQGVWSLPVLVEKVWSQFVSSEEI